MNIPATRGQMERLDLKQTRLSRASERIDNEHYLAVNNYTPTPARKFNARRWRKYRACGRQQCRIDRQRELIIDRAFAAGLEWRLFPELAAIINATFPITDPARLLGWNQS